MMKNNKNTLCEGEDVAKTVFFEIDESNIVRFFLFFNYCHFAKIQWCFFSEIHNDRMAEIFFIYLLY